MSKTNPQSPENSNGSSDEDDGDDDGSTRVNISLPEEQHEEWTRFAEEQGMSFSRLVRRGCIEVRNHINGNGVSRELQPLFDLLETNQETLAEIRETLSELDHRIQKMERETEIDAEQIAEEIIPLFYDAESLTIPDIVEELDLDRRSVQRGIKRLESTYTVTRIEPSNPETEVVEFKLRGKEHE